MKGQVERHWKECSADEADVRLVRGEIRPGRSTRCVSTGASFHARPGNTSQLFTLDKPHYTNHANTYWLQVVERTCRLPFWDLQTDRYGGWFGIMSLILQKKKKRSAK